MSRLTLTGGRIVDPANGVDRVGNLVISDGIVETITEPCSVVDGEIRDVTGKLVTPGLIDMHVHLREPGFEYKEDIASGTRAACAGGFTAVCCMPNTNPSIDTPSVVYNIISKAEKSGWARVYPIAALTRGMDGSALCEIADLKAAGAVAISDDAHPIQNAETMRRGMEYCSQFDMPLLTHNEEKTLTEGGVMNEGYTATMMGIAGMPRVAEDIAVARNAMLARETGCRLHLLHISTAGAVEILRMTRAAGIPITGETAPHYWMLTDSALEGFHSNAKMNPPLRTTEDGKAILQGLKDGVIEVIATDHAPHAPYEKEMELDKAPFGIVGLETSFGLSYSSLVKTGLMSLNQLIDKMSASPARILGLPGGSLAPGSPADVSVFDLNCEWIVKPSDFKSKSRNTPFEGMTLQGRALFTVVGGKIMEV